MPEDLDADKILEAPYGDEISKSCRLDLQLCFYSFQGVAYRRYKQ